MAECTNDDLINNGSKLELPPMEISSLFNAYDLARYNKLADFVMGEIFRRFVGERGGITAADLTKPSVIKDMFRGIEAYMNKMLKERGSDNATNSIWKGLSDKAIEDIDKIINNFDVFLKNYAKYNNIVNTKEFDLFTEHAEDTDVDSNAEDKEEEDIDETEELANKGKDFDRIGNEQSQLELAASAIRILFGLTPKAYYDPESKTSKIWLDGDGLPQPCNMSNTWNLLADKLAGEKNYEKMKEILLSDRLKQVIPEVQFLNDILKTEKDDLQKTTSEALQFTQFQQVFMKSKVPIKTTFMGDEENTFALNDEILGNALKIEGTFNNNFISGNIPEDYKQYTKRTTSGVYFLAKTPHGEWIPPVPTNFEEKEKFLSFLGIQFTGIPFLSPNERETYVKMVDETATPLYNSLLNRLESGAEISDPIKELKSRYSRLIPAERTSIDRIITFESIWSRIVPTHSSRNVMGELQHLIMNDSALTMATYYLNSAQTLDELYSSPAFIQAKNNPQFATSYIINFLFDKKGNKMANRTINLEIISGSRVKADSKIRARIERQLSNAEKIVQDYNNFIIYGRTDVMRTETSHSFYMISLSEKGNPKRYVNPKGFTPLFFTNRDFRKQILNYLNGEITRIKSYEQKKRENTYLPDNYGQFSIFSEVFDGKNDELKADLLKEDTLTIDTPAFTQFAIEYEKVLDAELVKFKALLNKHGITDKKLISKQLKELNVSRDGLDRAFIAGTLMQNIEFSILYAGDALFYKDMHKRLKGLSSTGNIAIDSSLLRSYFSTIEARTFDSKYSLFGATGKNRRDNTNNFKTQVLEEYKITPWNNKNKSGFAYLNPQLPSDIQKSVQMRDGDIGIYTTEYINKLLSKATDQKPADGQGYINMDFHRELSFRFGFSTPETETSYKYEGLIYRRDILGEKLTEDEDKELTEYTNRIFTDPDKYALPVLKMTYWGNIENTTVDGKAYDKFSVAPILPSHARNHSGMREIMSDMVKGDYGYVKYESGTKAFKRAIAKDLKDVEADLYSIALLKEQIKTNNEQSTDTAIPTQLLKLIFANLFDGGTAKTPRIKAIYDKYISSLSDIQKEQIDRTLADLGVTYTNDDGKVVISSIDMAKMSKKLIREATSQQLNSNIISSLQIDPKTGTFRILAEATGFQDQINSLVAGILDRNLRRFKFPGGDFTLVSNANHSPLQWYKFSEDGTSAIGCRITLTREYTKLLNQLHPDGERIGTIERLNKLLKNKEWRKTNEKSLVVILDRVPTQGHNSMEFATVEEFLPPTMGNVIILPEEIVFKAGLDFDYDKEKVLTPSLDANGNYLTKNVDERLKEVISKLNELQDIYPELTKLSNEEEQEGESYTSFLVNKIFNTSAQAELFRLNREADALLQEYYSLKADVSSLKSNSILETYRDILSAPETFAELISPNTTLSVQDLANKNADNTGNHLTLPQLGRTYYYTDNLNVFRTFFDAKGLLGAFATDNTFQQLLTYNGININDKYRIKRFDTWVGEKINNLLLSPEEYAKVHQNGRIMTSLREDVLGYIKQHWNNENINATVDAAKDPFFATMRIVWENIGVVNLLKNLGVPFERIVDFINNPTMQYYFSLIQSGMKRGPALEKVGKERLALKKSENKQRPVTRDAYSLITYMSDNELREQGIIRDNETVPIDKNTGRRMIQKKGDTFLATFSTTSYPASWDIKDIFREINNQAEIKIPGYEYLNKWLNYNEITPDRLKWLARPENDRQAVKNDPDRKSEITGIYSDDIRLLAHFIQMENVNYAFRDFQKYFNFDTTKTATSLNVRLKENLRTKMNSQRLFTKDDINKMSNDSILSSYINNDLIRSIYDKMFPILGRPIVQNYLAGLYEAYDAPSRFENKSKRDLRIMPKVLSQDFLTSIVLSYGTFGGKNLFDMGYGLLVRKSTGTIMKDGIEISQTYTTTMVDRLVKFRQKSFYKEIATIFPVLDRLISNKLLVSDPFDLNGFQEPFIIENIQLIKNPNETLLEQEEVIEQFRDMYYQYKYEKGTPQQNDKINDALHTFLEELFVTGIIQSGFSKTQIGYSEYIPVEFTNPIYTAALDRFQQLSDDNVKEYLSTVPGGFYIQFMNNNPKYFPFYKTKGDDGKNIPHNNNNKYYNRMKVYRVPVQPNQVNLTDKEGPSPTAPQLPAPPTSPITPNHTIPMNFEDGTGGREMRDEFKGKSTLELIKEGKRTATSRDRSKSYNQQNIKVGDIIKFFANQGKSSGDSVLVRVTKAPYPLSQVTAEEWSKLEGWKPTNYESLKAKGYEQFQYELLNKNTPLLPSPAAVSEPQKSTPTKETPPQAKAERLTKVYPQEIEEIPSVKLQELANMKFPQAYDSADFVPENIVENTDKLTSKYGAAASLYVTETENDIYITEAEWLKANEPLSSKFMKLYLNDDRAEGSSMTEFAQTLLGDNVKLIDTAQMSLFEDGPNDSTSSEDVQLDNGQTIKIDCE